MATGYAGTFQWLNATGNWNVSGNWAGGVPPSGTDDTDILMFGGSVASPYVSTNNLPPVPALINRLVFNASSGGGPANVHTIDGTALAFGGVNPQIIQADLGGIVINAPIELRASLVLGGNGGTVTLNRPISGAFDIAKEGSSTFRFGTIGLPSSNRWAGRLTIAGGTIRLDEFSASAAALRGNPVRLTSATSQLTTTFELRAGTLSGPLGLVESRVPGPNFDNEDIVIHAITDGTFDGTLRLVPATGSGRNTGTLIIRGAAKQTLTGLFVSADSAPGANALQISKDVTVGHGATLSLSGNASLAQQTAAGAIVMAGGTFEIDNQSTNNANRLRDGDSGSTGLDSAGGGLFKMIGHALGTTELMSRLQLGSPTNARSGALTIRVVHNAGATAATQLVLQSLSRDGFSPTFSTVNFDATDGAGTEIPLGQSGSAPRISFVAPPLQANGLLRNTRNLDVETVGWATVNGFAFATHGPNGIAPVALVPAPAGSSAGDPTANIEILNNFVATNASGYAVNSLRLQPDAAGQRMEFNSGDLQTNALLLAGTRDYAIVANGNGGWSGVPPQSSSAAARYAYVESSVLTLGLRLNNTFLPLVKSGEGTLALTNPANANSFSPTVLNEGTLRASAETLPIGELRFRGGVLEITGGALFARSVGYGAGAVNWIGIDEFNNAVDEDAGSGGFAALGADVSIDLNGANPSIIEWESRGFLESGHALVFGSPHADHAVTWTDQLSLSSSNAFPKYDAREIRVLDNPLSGGDRARFTAPITGNVQTDLLKTGSGVLELASVNSYLGATIVHEGTLLVNVPGSISQSFLTEVHPGATLGGNGNVGAVRVLPGGRLAPGRSIFDTGVLATGDLTFDGPGALFSVQILGPTAGTFFDQLVVTGSITLNGADLEGSLINGFNPAPNDLFFLMLNDGNDPVNGTFAQGSLITINNAPFEIFYAGNSITNSATGGNDVGVRFIPEPTSALLAAGGTLGIALMRRRRR
jgi:autotransporter-associated beta strand protein